MSGYFGSAHDAVGQLQSEIQRLRDSNERLIRALQQAVAARHEPSRLQGALDKAEKEIARALRGA